MNKKLIRVLSVILIAGLTACKSGSTASETLPLGGVEYPAIFVKSGYYYDKASLSDAVLADMLSKITTVEKPKDMGTVELPEFSKITLTNNKKVEIDSAMIEAELEKERDGETTYTPIKLRREAKLTDKVIIDFKGYVNGEELEGGSGEDYELVLGSGQFIPGFEEQVAGHNAGRKFNIDVTFPQEYDPSLAGKPAKFEITTKSIEEAITPNVDEEFVKRHTKENSVTVDQYKDEIKRRIEKRNVFLNNQNLIYQLTEYLFENTKFNPSEEALAWQFSMIMEQYNRQAVQSGTTFANLATANGASIQDAYEEIKSSVPQAVQSTMLMDELQKKYKITLNENDVKAWFEMLAQAMGYDNQITYDDYKQYMGYDNIKTAVEQEKTLLKVIESCNVVDEEVEE